MRRAAFTAIMLLLLLLPVAGLELALRVAGLGDPLVYYTNLTYRYAPMPDQKVARFDGATITINRHGLRATKQWDDPADLRVLFVGDSVTWGGSHVTDADTFADRTCALIGEALSRRATCGNAGVNGYGTDNMAQRIRHGGPYGEDWLVVVILSRDAARSLQDIRVGHYHLAKPSGPLRAMWEAATYWTYRLNIALRGSNERETPDEVFSVARDSMRGLLDLLRDKERAGTRVLVVLTVYAEEFAGREFDLTGLVREEIVRSGLRFLDMVPVVRERLRPEHFVDQVHLSGSGHAVFAEAIAARLVAESRPR